MLIPLENEMDESDPECLVFCVQVIKLFYQLKGGSLLHRDNLVTSY